MIKKLLILIRLFFSKKQNQNTPTFTGTELFGNNAKWLCFFFFVFQVGFGQTCNVVTNPTFTGNANGWTLGGSGVGWYYEATWAPGEIYIEKDGALDQSLKQSLTGLINNSLTLSFKIKGQNANRLSTCPTTASIVIKLGGNTYMTINNPAGSIGSPNTQITTANITTSNGATYTQTGFPLTVGGATSGITITQGTITLTIPWNPATSTIADLEFVATTSSTASGSCLAWGGDDWFLDDIMLYTSNPVAYNMTGTSICEGSSTAIGLSNSQLGVNYQLYRNGSIAVGSPVAGTGIAISFGSQSVTGVYTAIATAGTTGCTTPMNGSVSINPNPTLTNAAQPVAQPAVCAGSAATINLTGLLPNTTSTINYTINGVAQTAITGVTSNVSGAGSFTTPILTIANNGQILQITGVTNTSATPNCTSSFARNVTLAVNPIPTLTGASQPVAACVGSGTTINLTGLLPSVTSTISYSIDGVAQTAVTGVVSDALGAASFNSAALTAANNGQQLRITGVATTSTTPSCSASFTQNVILSVNPVPTLTGAAQSAAVCAGSGALINLTGLPVNSTSTINYTINNVAQTAVTGVVANGSGAASFTSAVLTAANNGQQLRITSVTVTSSTPNCSAAFTHNVTLAVNPVLTASVSISTSPAGTICAGTSVTFTATPTSPGTSPVYQWKLNGVNVGTNSTTYSNNTLLLNNDVVTCEMTSNASPCLIGSPATSNAIIVASAGPTTTGVTICAGGSGTLSSSTTCIATQSSSRGAGIGATATGVGTLAWSNPGRINTDDNSNSTASRGSDGTTTTNYLQATNFGFAIPTDATITGIVVSVNRYGSANSGSDYVRDNVVSLIKSGLVTSTNRALTTTNWVVTTTNVASYGATNDLWGSSWNPADINATNFGVALSANITRNNGTVTANVDYMSITVTYTVPGSIDWYTASSAGTFLGSGASFNPVGVAGSGLVNTNNAGSAIFYAECSSNPGCRTPATFVIRATPTATISGTTSVCQGAASPNVTFTNPLSEAITVTYNINGGTNATINVASNASTTVAAPTGTSGTFVYNLVSAVYQSGTACSANITGSATVTVRPTVTATISGTTMVCQGTSSPNVTFTNPLSSAITVTYNINGGTNATVNVGANTTATVAASTGASGTFVYNLVSAVYQSGTACSANIAGSATVTVRPTVTATISGTTIVCQGATSPNITFTNPLSDAITVTYNINGGTSETVNVGANTTATVAAPTSTSGTFVYNLVSAVYQSGTACSTNITGSATVTIRPMVTATISGTSTVCQGATAPNITFTNPLSAAITVTYNINGGTSATVNVGANTTATVAAPTGTSGTFVYNLVSAIYQSGTACSATVTGSATIIINPTPLAPTVGTVTHISCTANTGSVVLGDLPNGNWTINQTGDATATYSNTIANTTSTTISGLAAGTYTFIVTNASGCPSATSSVSILDNSNTWNGSSWSKGVPPNASMNVIITSVTPSSPFTVDLVGCALTINSGVVATVPTGITLTITNEVAVYGQLTFENNASLVQINNVANVGPIIYKRNSQPMKNFDYTYWSSPVEGQTFYNFSPNTLWDKYLSFTGTVWQEELGSTIMKPGIGYIIRVPKPNSVYMNGKDYWTGSSYIQQVEFVGRPNNGNITSSQYMEKDKYYLIGNPYPSAIHADDFLYNNVNNRAILGGTVYFWTHNTAIKVVNSKLAYVSDDYASYNLTGGTATRAALSPGLNTEIPQGYIAAGQSFFTSAEDGSGYVEFTNAMRYGETYNGQFFKPGKTSKPARMEKHRLWLNMTNSGGVYKQTLIGYIEGATNTYDKSFDGLSFDGNSYVDFYSINAADNLTIQGRSLPFTDTDVVPLGYRSTIAGDFTIAIDKADGNLATQRVYLEDKQTGTISELTAGNYTFTTKAGTFNNRFVLRYTNKTLGTGDFETTDDAVSVFIQNKTITVNSTVENIDKVFVYDISGKHLYKKDEVKNLQLIIQNLPFAQQVLLVKVVLDNGYQTTKKVIFK